jgi:glycyl-tRNA synthetase
MVKSHFYSFYDENDSIGRRYRRQDEVGTPFCITIDFDSIKKNDVTVRDRNTMKQKRIKIKDLVSFLKEKLEE